MTISYPMEKYVWVNGKYVERESSISDLVARRDALLDMLDAGLISGMRAKELLHSYRKREAEASPLWCDCVSSLWL